MDETNDPTPRRYLVATDSGSTHLIDLDRRTIARFRSPSASDDIAMRNDLEESDLLAICSCTVGTPLVVVIDLHLEPPRTTIRTTTPVVSITRYDGVVGSSTPRSEQS